jgi:DNA-binding NarL/FixJ family response regulator
VETTVALVVDDARLRGAFAHAVLGATGLAFVGAADDVDSGRALIDNQRPDALLVDLGLPGGIELIRHAVRCCPGCDVMAITASQDLATLLASIKAGVTGFASREVESSELVEQVHVMRAGGSPMPPEVARNLLHLLAMLGPRTATRTAHETPIALLSAQERKVLEIASKGYGYDEIAEMMGVSRETVLTYAKRIYRKLKVHTKTEAIYEARCLGWLLD